MAVSNTYSADLTVSVEAAGDVSDDVSSVTIVRQADGANSVSITVDTSKRPHAFQELRDVDITVSSGGETVTFSGHIDSIRDQPDTPEATIDAREPEGVFDDVDLLGTITGTTLFDVIDMIVTQANRDFGSVSFDPEPLKSNYDVFSGDTVFGYTDIVHDPSESISKNGFTDSGSLSNDESELMLDFSGTFGTYVNNTSTTFQLTVDGTDVDGTSVTGAVDLPPGADAQSAFGTTTPKITQKGDTAIEKFTDVTGISTDISGVSGDDEVTVQSKILSIVQTSFEFDAQDNVSARSGLDRVVNYISGLAEEQWTYYVNPSEELKVLPEAELNSRIVQAVEGDNVARPIATRDMDTVRNFIKVDGDDGVNAWAWAIDQEFRIAESNPKGSLSSAGTQFDTPNDGGDNAIENSSGPDGIGLRADVIQNGDWTNQVQVNALAKEELRERYPTHVSGTARYNELIDIRTTDKIEVYYPSRGIPARVSDNRFRAERVEYEISQDTLRTVVGFGTRTTTSEAVTILVERLLDDLVFTPVKGTVSEVNSDGTADIDAASGETYTDVDII